MARFWTSENQDNIEPKRPFKFKVIFKKEGSVISLPPQYIISVQKPSFQVETQTFDLLDKKKVFPGKITYNPIELTYIDTIDNTVSAQIYSLIYSSRLFDVTVNPAEIPIQDIDDAGNPIIVGTIRQEKSIDFYQDPVYQMGERKFDYFGNSKVNGRIDLEIIELNSDGEKVASYIIEEGVVSSVATNNSDYSDDGFTTFTLKVEYDYYKYKVFTYDD